MAGLHILETALYASDLDAAERFYADVLDLELDSRAEGRHVFFRCGDAMLLVFDPAATSTGSGPIPAHGAHGPGHVAFAVPDDAELAVRHERLIEAGVELATRGIWGVADRNP